MGLVNHHDAITGTSKQHVAEDYKKILSKGLATAESFLMKAFGYSFSDTGDSSVKTLEKTEVFVCRSANESICDVTQSLNIGESVQVIVYNSLPRTRSQQVTVYLSPIKSMKPEVKALLTTGWTIIPSDFIKNVPIASLPHSAPYSVVFSADNVPALAARQFLVTLNEVENDAAEIRASIPKKSLDTLIVSTSQLSVTIDTDTGLLQSITRLATDSNDQEISAKVTQDLKYYKSFGSPGQLDYKYPKLDKRDPHLKNVSPLKSEDAISSQASGAYIFRTTSKEEVATPIRRSSGNVILSSVKGKQVIEVRQNFSSWASQVIRLREGSLAVEIEWTVGPIPIDDNFGKEVVSQVTSELNSGGKGSNKIYTDSNGREFLERIYNYRPTYDLQVYEPIAGNYYPITCATYIKDEDAQLQLSILTDRSHAAASLDNGEMEVMLHRRLLADDNKGVEEALNETSNGMSGYPDWQRFGDGITVRGKQYLLLSSVENGMKEVRTLMDELYSPFYSLYSNDQNIIKSTIPSELSSSLISFELPVNIQLMTLELYSKSELLVRLGHQFAPGEDKTLSQPVEIDLFALLSRFSPKSADEVNLSANQLKAVQNSKKIRWNTFNEELITSNEKINDSTTSSSDTSFKVVLHPMQIKTFIVQL